MQIKNQRGVTLIELLIVLVIVAIFAAASLVLLYWFGPNVYNIIE